MKLILNEEEFVNNEQHDSLSISTMINQMIKGEWDAIDLYNGILASVELDGNHKDLEEVIKDIVSEEYIHVGQLEKLLQNNNPVASEIETGKNEAEKEQINSLENNI